MNLIDDLKTALDEQREHEELSKKVRAILSGEYVDESDPIYREVKRIEHLLPQIQGLKP